MRVCTGYLWCFDRWWQLVKIRLAYLFPQTWIRVVKTLKLPFLSALLGTMVYCPSLSSTPHWWSRRTFLTGPNFSIANLSLLFPPLSFFCDNYCSAVCVFRLHRWKRTCGTSFYARINSLSINPPPLSTLSQMTRSHSFLMTKPYSVVHICHIVIIHCTWVDCRFLIWY